MVTAETKSWISAPVSVTAVTKKNRFGRSLEHCASLVDYVRRKFVQYSISYLAVWNFFQMSQSDDLDNDIDELLQEFESRCQRTILHTLLFY